MPDSGDAQEKRAAMVSAKGKSDRVRGIKKASGGGAIGKYDQEVMDFWSFLNVLEDKVSSGSMTEKELLAYLDEIRPRTENGREVCSECYCFSMRHIVTVSPGRNEENTVLACEICGFEDLSLPE
jgi:hypothetical protein